jgi:hypothetical protein
VNSELFIFQNTCCRLARQKPQADLPENLAKGDAGGNTILAAMAGGQRIRVEST